MNIDGSLPTTAFSTVPVNGIIADTTCGPCVKIAPIDGKNIFNLTLGELDTMADDDRVLYYPNAKITLGEAQGT